MIASTPDLSHAKWRKSSYSANGGNCVEVTTHLPSIIVVRDSKDPHGPRLTLRDQAWSEFVQGVRRGEFDL
jgi:Domain of unknown function (DUF397)